MKATLLLGLLASTSFTSARVQPSTHALAVAVSLFSGPLPAFAKPVWRYTSTRLSSRQANSTTGAATGTYTVVSGDTLDAIAATEGISTQALEDANPGVVPTDLQVGQVLNMPSSASSNGTSSSDNTPAAMQSNSVDASDLGDGVASGSSAAETGTGTGTGTAPKSTASGCGGGHHHHHDNSTTTAGSSAKAHNGTEHHSHNGTTTEHRAHNSTLVDAGAGECNATSHHHHHNGTETGAKTTAETFFIPVTATASALAVALTAPAAARDVDARALEGLAVMLHRA